MRWIVSGEKGRLQGESAILAAMPAPRYVVTLQVGPRYARYVRPRSLAALARRALAAEEARTGTGVGVVVTDDATVRDLNARFLGIDEPTDVLSFGFGGRMRFVTPRGGDDELGEIVISYPTAARQARAARHRVDDELAHLLVHGVLHLLGYDHERPADERRMRAREEEILGRRAH
jgi:probable rRNA maturation factor